MRLPLTIPNASRAELLKKWNHQVAEGRHIFTWTDGHELAWLAEMASQCTQIVEIGSYYGRSARVMALASPNADIFCIDNFENPGSEVTCRHTLRNFIEEERIEICKSTSDRLQEFDPPEGDGVHFGFIDAGHLYEDVKKDIANLRRIMIRGGVLSGHDWRPDNMHDGVNKAVLEAFGSTHKIHIFDSIWAVQL